MNRRVKKKILRRNIKRLELGNAAKREDLPISPYVCPICSNHVITVSQDRFACLFCRKNYGMDEIPSEKTAITVEEREKIQRFSNRKKVILY